MWSFPSGTLNVPSSPRRCSTWHDGLHAGVALGGVLVAVALDTHQGVVLGGEGPLHQRAAAQAAQETLAVPVPLFVGQILWSRRVS